MVRYSYCKVNFNGNLIILTPKWLTNDIIGTLLWPDLKLNLFNQQKTQQQLLELNEQQEEQQSTTYNELLFNGCLTVDEIETLFPTIDALDLLQILEALELCTQSDTSKDIEYEFPMFNKRKCPLNIWTKSDNYSNYLYCGIRLKLYDLFSISKSSLTPMQNQLACFTNGKVNQTQRSTQYLLATLFPRIQIILRQRVHEHQTIKDLYSDQWSDGSYLIMNRLEALIKINKLNLVSESIDEYIDIKVRGPSNCNIDCFYFIEDLTNLIECTLKTICPLFTFERNYFSPTELRDHIEIDAIYSSSYLINEIMKSNENKLLLTKN